MEETDRDLLRKIIEDLLQSSGYVVNGLKSRNALFDLFREAQNRFFEAKGRKFLENPFSIKEHNDFVEVSAEILKGFGLKLKKDILLKGKKKKSWVTSEVLKGAYGHEIKQPRDAY